MPAPVDSLLHPEALKIRQVLTRAGRLDTGDMLIDDEENLRQALEAGLAIKALYFSGDQRISEELHERLPAGAAVHEIAWRTCKKLFGTEKISRLFGIARMPEPLLLQALSQENRDIVVLEDVSISGNIGNILRTAVAFGLGAMVQLGMQHVDVYDRRLIRASRGFVFRLPIVTADPEDFVQWCRSTRRGIAVAAADAATRPEEMELLPEPLALVFGSEKGGASEALKAAAAFQVCIPILRSVESLNVSAAAAILLYRRTRHNAPEM